MDKISQGSCDTTFSNPWNECHYDGTIYEEMTVVNEKSSKPETAGKLWKKILPTTKKILQFVSNKSVDQDDKCSDVDSGIEADFSLGQKVDQSYQDFCDSFNNLKLSRDSELVKIRQATTALKILISRKNRHCEKLILERILLEASVKQKIILEKIMHLGYSQIKKKNGEHLGRLSITDIKIPITPKKIAKKTKEVYTLMTIQGDKVKLWDNQERGQDFLQFKEEMFFDQLETNFSIIIKIFCIQLNNSNKVFQKNEEKNKICKISYNDVNTLTNEEIEVFQTSFQCMGEFIINKDTLNGPNEISLIKIPDFSPLQKFVKCNIRPQGVEINAKLGNFLTLGKEFCDRLDWERKWCTLEGKFLSIFNYPSDQECCDCFNLDKTMILVNAEETTSRKHTFSLKFRNHKYYFKADNSEEYREWYQSLATILDSLRLWEMP